MRRLYLDQLELPYKGLADEIFSSFEKPDYNLGRKFTIFQVDRAIRRRRRIRLIQEHMESLAPFSIKHGYQNPYPDIYEGRLYWGFEFEPGEQSAHPEKRRRK